MKIVIFSSHGCEIPLGIDSSPKYRGLVHIFLILEPHVHGVGVVELAGEGHLAIDEGV